MKWTHGNKVGLYCAPWVSGEFLIHGALKKVHTHIEGIEEYLLYSLTLLTCEPKFANKSQIVQVQLSVPNNYVTTLSKSRMIALHLKVVYNLNLEEKTTLNGLQSLTSNKCTQRQKRLLLTKINRIDLNVHIQDEVHLKRFTFTM